MDKSETESRYIVTGDQTFDVAERTVTKLVPGIYAGTYDHRSDTWLIKKDQIVSDVIDITNAISKKILAQIKTFWEMEAVYKENEILHKRGFLLVGRAGCGKSSTINEVIKESIVHGAIAFFPKRKADGSDLMTCLTKIKTVEKDKKILIVMEDFETFTDDDESTSVWLNIMDGSESFNNIVFLATSNYPEKIDPRFTSRPSRFDTIYTITPPTKEDRIAYLRKKQPDLESIMFHKIIHDTNDMSYASMKELIVATVILKMDYDETLARLRKNADEPVMSSSFEADKPRKIGFVAPSRHHAFENDYD